jgi:Arc/MetJ family transcription regulator
MKTAIDLDEELIKKAMVLAGTSTKKETIKLALEELIKSRQHQKIKEWAGSGMLDMSLKELKSMRKRRQKEHKTTAARR